MIPTFNNLILNFILFTPIFLFLHYGGVYYTMNLYSLIKNKFITLQEIKKSQKLNNKEFIKILLVTIYSFTYYSFLQFLNKNVQKINKNTYEITYTLSDQTYKIITKARKGPCPIQKILDENESIVTDEIIPYMGPNYDWHSQEFSPVKLGFKSLTFYSTNSEEYKKFENECIITTF